MDSMNSSLLLSLASSLTIRELPSSWVFNLYMEAVSISINKLPKHTDWCFLYECTMLQNMVGLDFFLVWGVFNQVTERNVNTCHRRKKYTMSIWWEMCTADKDRESKVFIAWWNSLAVGSLVLVGCLSVAV